MVKLISGQAPFQWKKEPKILSQAGRVFLVVGVGFSIKAVEPRLHGIWHYLKVSLGLFLGTNIAITERNVLFQGCLKYGVVTVVLKQNHIYS